MIKDFAAFEAGIYPSIVDAADFEYGSWSRGTYYSGRTVATSNSVLSETMPSTPQLARRTIDAFLFMVQPNTFFPESCKSAIRPGVISRWCSNYVFNRQLPPRT